MPVPDDDWTREIEPEGTWTLESEPTGVWAGDDRLFVVVGEDPVKVVDDDVIVPRE